MGDRDLSTELQKVSVVLASPPSSKAVVGALDLEKRLDALKRLSKLARDDISTCHGFLSLMSTFVKVPLRCSIEECRTVLSSEACAVVTAFAEYSTNRSAWQIASEWFVASLLHLTTRTKQVSVKAAVKALEALARTNSFGSGAFSELLRGCVTRHVMARRHALSVLQLVIQQYQNDDRKFHIAKHIDAVCKVLRDGLTDADAEMRRCARRCYWVFYTAEPEAASVLYKGLEKLVRRALDGERPAPVLGKKDTSSSVAQFAVKEAKPVKPVTVMRGSESEAEIAAEGNVEQGCFLNAAESGVLVRGALQSPSWSQRLLGIRRFSEEFHHLRNKVECVKLLLLRLNDPNPRVAQAAIEVIQKVMRLSPTLLKDELPELITALFVNVSGNKEVLSGDSRELLAAIICANPVDSVAHAIYRALGDVIAPKVKVHAMEYIQYLFTQNAGYLAQLAPMKLAMTQMLLMLQCDRRNGDVHKAVVSVLTTLYAASKSAFLRALLQLSPDEREAVVDALEVTVPHLAQECRRRSWDGRPLQHPPLDIRSPFAEALMQHGGASPTSREGGKRLGKVSLSRATPPSSTKKEFVQQRARSVHESEREQLEKKEDDPSPIHAASGVLTVCLSPNSKATTRRVPHPLETKGKTSVDALAMSHQIVCDDDASAILDRLDTASGVVDTCSLLDQINNMLEARPKTWFDVYGRLLSQLERRIPDFLEPSHIVRCRSLVVLHTVVGSNSLRRPVCRSLKRILLLARCGVDDAFAEVQEKAAALLQVILLSGGFSADDCLNALAASLETWYQDQCCYSSRGWLLLLESMERLFSRLGRSIVLIQGSTNEHTPSHDFPPGVLSQPVLCRACGVAVRALQHNVSEVRLTAVLVCVSIWMALDTSAFPYFVDLTASQRKLISIYFNKMISERMPELQSTMQRRDLSREMRVMGLPDATRL